MKFLNKKNYNNICSVRRPAYTTGAFTLVELIVVITILAILGTIAFISLQGYSSQARDSKRLSDIQNIKKSLELFSLNTGKYPLPDTGVEYSFSGELLWTQGIVGDQMSTNLSRNLNEKPLDPLSGGEYVYSVTNAQTQYEVLGLYESELVSVLAPSLRLKGRLGWVNQSNAATQDYPKISGTYNGIYVKSSNFIFPTPSIINALNVETDFNSNSEAIESQIITGGDNNIGGGTGALSDLIMTYTGVINDDSSDAEKISVIETLQNFYSGTSLSSIDEIADLLSKTTDDEKKDLAEFLVLNSGVVSITSGGLDVDTGIGGIDEYTKLMLHMDNNPDGTIYQAMDINQEGNWDTANASAPAIIKDGEIYKMWYSGHDGTNWRILYTTSVDGINWNTPIQSLNINQEGSWDTNYVFKPFVIREGEIYKMWYSGYSGSHWRILYTTSTDGINWNAPIQSLDINQEGNWDTTHIYTPYIIKDEEIYKMWYAGHDGTNWRILYTTSTNGINWNTPIQSLNINQEGNWDTSKLYGPSIIKDGNIYKMWYAGKDSLNSRILYTTSEDGINWNTPIQSLDINQEGNWDISQVYTPYIIKDNNVYKMWYAGHDGSSWRILYTENGISDNSNSGHDAMMGNGEVDKLPSTVTGKFTNALSFDGVDEYLSIADSEDWNFGSDDFTIDFWINTNTYPINNTWLMGQGNNLNTNWSVFPTLYVDGNINISFCSGNNCYSSGNSITDIVDGNWHHIAGVRNNNILSIYIDGVKENEVDIGGIVINNSSEPFNIGSVSLSAPRYFNGYLDELRISKGIARRTEDFTLPSQPYSE